jgi:preprotein translocase subunit SecG
LEIEMSMLLLAGVAGTVLGLLMGFLSVFLVLLVLIQRGKGGGLTGALGGPGGQSAFGSKAGDTFTVITIVVASIWGFTCAFTMWLTGQHESATISKTSTSIEAGPGDDEAMPLPLGSGSGLGSDFLDSADLFGNEGGSNLTAPTETPSVELTPKDPASDTPDSETPAAEEPESN